MLRQHAIIPTAITYWPALHLHTSHVVQLLRKAINYPLDCEILRHPN
jgi:hypothetical protein